MRGSSFPSPRKNPSILVLGIGSFAHSTAKILSDNGAKVSTYLTRNYGHYPATLGGKTFDSKKYLSPLPILKREKPDLVIPMSIDWAQASWKNVFKAAGVPIFCPTGEGMRIERERDFARELCATYGIPFAKSYVAQSRAEAERILKKDPRPYVIKNPLCSPTSPIHTILCETVEDTRSWLPHLDYSEGVFLQEYLGRAEIGHIAIISGGKVTPLVTNQEYKRAFDGNQGVVAGAPMGGPWCKVTLAIGMGYLGL